jgi:hypothetical protein
MTDGNLLIFGCAVSFIVLGGVYVYLRDGFSSGNEPVVIRTDESAAVVESVEVSS